VDSSGFRVSRAIYMIIKGLALAMFSAFPVLPFCKLLIINKLLVEAAGVGLVLGTENT
jgi:hypothetical protein